MTTTNSPSNDKKNVRHRNWAFTSYNVDIIGHLKANTDAVSYVRVQEEFGEEDDKQHFQGCICFKSGKTFSAAKSFFDDDTIHIEVMKSKFATYTYCRKIMTASGLSFEYGSKLSEDIALEAWDRRKKQALKDILPLKGLKQAIDSGREDIIEVSTTYKDVWEQFVKQYPEYALEKPGAPLHTFYIYGDPGTGKNYILDLLTKELGVKAYTVTTHKFFDRITPADKVLEWNEFSDQKLNSQEFNELVDNRHSYKMVKHGSVKTDLDWFFITSNQDYDTVYANNGELVRTTFARRINITVEMRAGDVQEKRRRIEIKVFSIGGVEMNGTGSTVQSTFRPDKPFLTFDLKYFASFIAQAYLHELYTNNQNGDIPESFFETYKHIDYKTRPVFVPIPTVTLE